MVVNADKRSVARPSPTRPARNRPRRSRPGRRRALVAPEAPGTRAGRRRGAVEADVVHLPDDPPPPEQAPREPLAGGTPARTPAAPPQQTGVGAGGPALSWESNGGKTGRR